MNTAKHTVLYFYVCEYSKSQICKNLLVSVFYPYFHLNYNIDMDIKEILFRIGYVRSTANLSAREVSLRMAMSPQYVAQLESGRIVLTVEKLLHILEICNFPIERFFSANIYEYEIDNNLRKLISALPQNKKNSLIIFLKN